MQTYDGDGSRTKLIEKKIIGYINGSPTYQTVTSYEMRSSVLGGSVITELTSTGTKERGYVYADTGDVVAWQNASGLGVTWEHRDASGSSRRTSSQTGVVNHAQGSELDPLNSDAGIMEPIDNALPPRVLDILKQDAKGSVSDIFARYPNKKAMTAIF